MKVSGPRSLSKILTSNLLRPDGLNDLRDRLMVLAASCGGSEPSSSSPRNRYFRYAYIISIEQIGHSRDGQDHVVDIQKQLSISRRSDTCFDRFIGRVGDQILLLASDRSHSNDRTEPGR